MIYRRPVSAQRCVGARRRGHVCKADFTESLVGVRGLSVKELGEETWLGKTDSGYVNIGG